MKEVEVLRERMEETGVMPGVVAGPSYRPVQEMVYDPYFKASFPLPRDKVRRMAERDIRKTVLAVNEWRSSVVAITTRKQRKELRKELVISPVRSDELQSTMDIDWYGHAPWETLPKAIRNYRRAIKHHSVKWTESDLAILKEKERACHSQGGGLVLQRVDRRGARWSKAVSEDAVGHR